MNIKDLISERVVQAMTLSGIPEINCKPQVRQTSTIKFGHYQVDGIIYLAKKMGMPSILLANNIMFHLDLKDISTKIEVAGIGFINIFLDIKWMEKQAKNMLISPKLDVKNIKPQTVVLDYSSPNVAKEMHVGHLRSTIIGDAMARTLEFLGHKVIRANHIGDWGTQFGMLIAFLKDKHKNNFTELLLKDLEECYRKAKYYYERDPLFADMSRKYVLKLQKGDKECLVIWKKIVNISIEQNQKIYDRLHVTLSYKDIKGESTYNHMLPGIVNDLKLRGLAINNNGAVVVILNEFKNKQGKSMGVIIQKKDGAFLYATVDVACAKYRYEQLKADRIIYYTDSRQHQHLLQVWSIVRKAKYVPDSVVFEHHMFGMILDNNNNPFKTRSGETIKLSELLDEAFRRAYILVKNKNPDINHDQAKYLAEAIGSSAIKYSELSKNRTTDYVFNWDQMLTFEGNTAPYMQYAYTRLMSIFHKSGIQVDLLDEKIIITNNQEKILVMCILQFEEAIMHVAKKGTPHVICNYLYNLTNKFSSFYESCPILKAEDESIRYSRLQLSFLTSKVLNQCLNILGIKILSYM
ncbi:arginine--tRNA ligase [Candidatus Pantoea edessiphila]|uniref:Arginine--tRNA ligase n=1 Tax=Candidatus Pantoea edessiphila TaxID=2044610 RepID=A0A2P5SYL6_9GAMM|nr:arginine--tRNA ligase [Candidatus Pantoea edessiphila]MBK4775447.1 arginine--tRNA ligase [Pantoea sp. Edef]PPI87425.1 arginine--tRNA ligase [Candidatus Pantoea edessiphila]